MKIKSLLILLLVIGMTLTACTKKEATPIDEVDGTEMTQPDTTSTVDVMDENAE